MNSTFPHTEALCVAQKTSNHEKADPSDSGANVDVPAIFISHSGRQMPFAEHLFDALQTVNHTAFLDKHSLPKGSPFPRFIKRAAHGCKLGVVVLSEDFLTSTWPMRELEVLVLQRGPDAMTLPVFYKLHPGDLNSPKNLSRWRRMWKKKAGQNANQWEQAVKALNSFNGEVFVQGTSEVAYIMKVVRHICTLVPCPVPYDLSSIKGHQRLAQEVARIFERVKARHCEEASMVGLHGVGGLGKTTLCKTMVNFYTQQYLGRSCLIEFPFDGDKWRIMQECKRALKKLTNLRNTHLLNEVDSFDQVVRLMREHVKRYDVFLAIDNVWENSREEAKRLLGVGFSATSQILLTSRSEQVLQDLLIEHTNTSVGPLPTLDSEEAVQILRMSFKLDDPSRLVDGNQIDRFLERCRFNGDYHPLALKALAQHVKRMGAFWGFKYIEDRLSVILEEFSNADLHLEEVIRLNYENLPQLKKHLFLDIAILVTQFNIRTFLQLTIYAKAHWWLCFLYKEFPETDVTRLVYELALDGLIEIEAGKDGVKKIRVHDLFLDLAQMEAAKSSRFFTKKSTKSVEEMECERLERVFLRGDEDLRFFEKLQQQECRKLQVLLAADINIRSGIHLDFMPSLCVLILTFINKENRSVPTGLAIVEGFNASRVLNLNGLVQLQILWVEMCNFVETIAGLDALQNLQTLHIEGCPCLKNIDGLSGLIRLEALDVNSCESLKKMPDLSGLSCLERLWLSRNVSMEEVGSLSCALKEIRVEDCGALKKMPDLSGMTHLESLELDSNEAMEDVGSLSSALKDVRVNFCWALRKMPDMRGLTCLEKLELCGNGSMEEVECLSSALKHIRVEDCGALKRVPDVSGLTRLERLELWGNEAMEEVGGEYLSSTLEHLTVKGCNILRSLPSLYYSTHLQTLVSCGSLELEDGDWTDNLLKNDGWKRFASLRRLTISSWGSLKKLEVGDLSSLKTLEVCGCEALEEIGDLSALKYLEDLDIKDCPRLKKVGGLLVISTHLKRLSLLRCASVEESSGPDVSILNNMQHAEIRRCGNLKTWPVATQ